MFDYRLFRKIVHNYTIYSGYEIWPVNTIKPLTKKLKVVFYVKHVTAKSTGSHRIYMITVHCVIERQLVYVPGTESESPSRIQKTLNYINVNRFSSKLHTPSFRHPFKRD